jgi:hypothetical protein
MAKKKLITKSEWSFSGKWPLSLCSSPLWLLLSSPISSSDRKKHFRFFPRKPLRGYRSRGFGNELLFSDFYFTDPAARSENGVGALIKRFTPSGHRRMSCVTGRPLRALK